MWFAEGTSMSATTSNPLAVPDQEPVVVNLDGPVEDAPVRPAYPCVVLPRRWSVPCRQAQALFRRYRVKLKDGTSGRAHLLDVQGDRPTTPACRPGSGLWGRRGPRRGAGGGDGHTPPAAPGRRHPPGG